MRSFFRFGSLLVISLAAGCSDDPEVDGATGGAASSATAGAATGGGGNAGGGGVAGSSGGPATGTGGMGAAGGAAGSGGNGGAGGAGGAEACPEELGDTACTSCLKMQCCTELEQCEADRDCSCYVDCLQNGGSLEVCLGPPCANTSATTAVFYCAQDHCAECPFP